MSNRSLKEVGAGCDQRPAYCLASMASECAVQQATPKQPRLLLFMRRPGRLRLFVYELGRDAQRRAQNARHD